MNKILLVEDDMDLGQILKKYLEMNEFQVIHKTNGIDAWDFIQRTSVDICILDVMMPKMDGFELSRKIKKLNPLIPFIFLTAKSMKEDLYKGLKIGADDYITKPFDAEELLLRIKNILFRSKSQIANECIVGKYTFYPEKLELVFESKVVTLTVLEADLLKMLLQNKNKVVKREVILNELWGDADYFTGRSMDVFISRLRKYLNKDKCIEIKSFRGKGVMMLIH